jgi:lipocalin
MLRYSGKWYRINAKPYEPERQSQSIGWAQIKEPNAIIQDLYIQYFEKQRREAKILYPSFRKDGE